MAVLYDYLDLLNSIGVHHPLRNRGARSRLLPTMIADDFCPTAKHLGNVQEGGESG